MDKKQGYAFQYSEYQVHRQNFTPLHPPVLDLSSKVKLEKKSHPLSEGLKGIFKTLASEDMPYIEFQMSNDGIDLHATKPFKIAVVLSGGQAPGGHNVIAGVYDMAKKAHKDSKVYGFLGGPKGIFTQQYVEIDDEFMLLYRNQGGFDMICSGRDKIETDEQFENSLKAATAMDLDGLIVIGGDDSNTNACLLAEYFAAHKSKCSVVGCPKTIDGDLKNEHIEVSFGFDTATKTFSEAIGNLCADALSSKAYYYFIRVMGRSASHIAIECALNCRVNWVFIGEEVEQKKQTLQDITMQLADMVEKRAELGKDYGVVIVPEGLIEFIPEMGVLIGEINEIVSKEFKEDITEFVLKNLSENSKKLFQFLPKSISEQLLLDRDPHGNVQVSKIDTEKLLILLLQSELEVRKAKGAYKGRFLPQNHFFGYEGRCALPSNFDSSYCYCLGMNAVQLINLKCAGYMSCVKNTGCGNPEQWICAAVPLPSMMGIERRKGKDKPVITKALTRLDGDIFGTWEAVRDKWALLDFYRMPGPVQFQGANSQATPFLVKEPNKKEYIDATEKFIDRVKRTTEVPYPVAFESKGLVGQQRVQEETALPNSLQKNNYTCVGIKKYTPFSQQVSQKISDQFPKLGNERSSNYFVEVVDKNHLNDECLTYEDQALKSMNCDLKKTEADPFQVIGVCFSGKQAPGGQNVIDGLLRYAATKENTKLIGFIEGTSGLFKGEHMPITEQTYKAFRNMGGYEYLGRHDDSCRSHDELAKALETCDKLKLTGLVMVGATHTLTDAVILQEHFLNNGCKTKVIVVPATVDGNISHNYVATAVGFDTASKTYSQQIGNMLTDSASAIKYWYFIRLMGQNPSHLALECALKTQPNMCIISEDCAQKGETLPELVSRIADLVVERAEAKKNFGCILIPEGLLAHLPHYQQLITEINEAYFGLDKSQASALSEKIKKDEDYIKEILTPWSAAVFLMLPQFIRLELLYTRDMYGSIKLSQIETERLLAYLVEVELKKRKTKGTYKGAYSPVTHYFGYQGRCSYPSLFDSSLGSTYGFTAGVLLQHGFGGYCVSAKQVNAAVKNWRVGGVPLLSMLRSAPKYGYPKGSLVIQSEAVDLKGSAFQKLKVNEKKWRVNDHYCNPGPVQFWDYGNDSVAKTIKYRLSNYNEMCNVVKSLCASIQRDCTFVDNDHLLVAAISSLQSAKSVINAMTTNLAKADVE